MDKQEAIKELESHRMSGTDIRDFCYNEGINAGITVLKKLAEPDKPVIPNFVATWFEENKDNLDDAIFGYIVFWEERDTNSELHQWFTKSKNKPIETLVRMKDGYEVEKEPLYYVRLPYEVWDEEAAELKTEYLYLHYDITSDETRIFPTKEPRKGFVAKLDELTIKSADENYWAFAIPVEGDKGE